MEDLTLAVPGLWADHHVLAVLDLLREEQGITDVAASALDGTVRLRFDPGLTSGERIAAALEQGGYPCGTEGSTPIGQPPGSDWASGRRVTTTDPADLAMSGDHRKY